VLVVSVTASATTIIRADPKGVLEFVLDLNRYKEVDRKFVRVGKVIGPDADGRGSVRLWGRIRGFPPAPDRQDFVLERWSRLTFTGAARQPGRLVFDFVGRFVCDPAADGATRVTHSYEFTFKGPFRLAERKLATWLQQEIEHEVTNLARAISATNSLSTNPDMPGATGHA
jgi:hypothetical protein